ncbi:hypothetical protein FAY30_17880 [Bacillus sp. S3]|uniref:pilus assembly PilX N-terminal domain-containing protein n=1 Tax=Bacillus sp. S3 TaxID=486398 RepID=UPI0011881EFE|nr:pilus assembly PilX N-terminal domain-containing protein [Bacillus sp. S3]QCJ43634.1 hypothetical protein FAY30_17880 [Bacillus sp. S3]
MKEKRECLLNSIKNENGMALVTVLLVLVVVTILGLGLIGLSASNMKMSAGERNNQSAYYIAESGMTNAMSIINKEIPDIYKNSYFNSEFIRNFENEFIVKGIPDYNDFENSFGKMPVAKIKIESAPNSTLNPFTTEYKITSTGTIDNRSRSVEKTIRITWNPKSNIKIASNTVLFIGENLNWANTPATITGTVGLGLEADKKFTGSKIPQMIKYGDVTITEPEFPRFTIPSNSNSLAGSNLTISNDMILNSITVFQSGTLTINVGDINRILVVDTLKLSSYGKLKLIGDGTLTIYAKNLYLDYGTILNTGGDVNKLNIFLEGSGSQLNNGMIFGSMFAKNSSFTINDSSGVQGNVITGGSGIINLNNDKKTTPPTKMIFAPLATVYGNGNFIGTIIAKEFISSGNDHWFKFQQLTNPPYFIDNGTVNLPSGNLLTSDPVREK